MWWFGGRVLKVTESRTRTGRLKLVPDGSTGSGAPSRRTAPGCRALSSRDHFLLGNNDLSCCAEPSFAHRALQLLTTYALAKKRFQQCMHRNGLSWPKRRS